MLSLQGELSFPHITKGHLSLTLFPFSSPLFSSLYYQRELRYHFFDVLSTVQHILAKASLLHGSSRRVLNTKGYCFFNKRVGVGINMEGETVNGSSSRFKSVCVFCGSSVGNRDCYRNAAIELAQELVGRKLDLVYGGGSIGLMGLVSQAVHEAGGSVLGIIPRTLMSKEITGETVGEVRPVADMHQRKAEMARHSDCFIALPGGYGTLEELLEVITWAQLGIHDKPVGLLNVDGYYNYLLTFIDKAVDDGFIKPSQRSIIVSATNAKELVQKLEEYVPLHDGGIPKALWEVEEQQQPQSSPLPLQQEVVGGV